VLMTGPAVTAFHGEIALPEVALPQVAPP
jgi:hypothetical protein